MSTFMNNSFSEKPFMSAYAALEFLKGFGVTEEEVKALFWYQPSWLEAKLYEPGYTKEISDKQLREFIGGIVKKKYPQYRPNVEASPKVTYTLDSSMRILNAEFERAETYMMTKKTFDSSGLMRNLCVLVFLILFFTLCVILKVAAFLKFI